MPYITLSTNKQTPQKGVFPEMLMVTQLVKKCSPFMEPEGSLLSSQVPTSGPYSEPVESSPHLPNLYTLRSTLILSFHLCLGLPCSLFPPSLPTEILYAFLIPPIHVTMSRPSHSPYSS